MSSSGAQLKYSVVRQIELARAFLALAQSAARSPSDFNQYVATNHLQDATEIFLCAIAEQIGVGIKDKGFEGYFEQIKAKIGKDLPFRFRLSALNKTRVTSKHFGVQPDRKEVQAFLAVVREFFEEASRDLLDTDFSRISLVHLISSEKIRRALSQATEAFTEGRFEDALIETRKAFYHEFESRFDVSAFIDQKEYKPWKGWFCSAPTYAQTADYIEKNVKEPTDFIVLDHSAIDADLSKSGLSHTTFWNVWRLTPAVFLFKDSSRWVIKHDARVFDDEGIAERAEYALHATIDLCLSVQRNREATLSSSYKSWTIKLRQGKVLLYSKADSGSSSQPVPDDIRELSASYWVEGLDGRIYWDITRLKPLMLGFVSNDDILTD